MKGVGERAAVLFRAVKELGRRYGVSRASLEDIVDSTRAAREVFEPLFYGARNEMVYLLCMDGKGKYLGCPKVGEGNRPQKVERDPVTTHWTAAAAPRPMHPDAAANNTHRSHTGPRVLGTRFVCKSRFFMFSPLRHLGRGTPPRPKFFYR